MNARPQPSDFSHAAYEDMGSTLLAAQPPQPKDPKSAEREVKDWLTIYAHLEQRMAALRTWRWSWWVFWAVLAAFFIPFRYVFLVVSNRTWRGGNVNQQILNSKGVLAARTCASGMWTGLCSPSRPWFKLGIGTPWVTLDRDGKNWLKDVEEKLYTIFGQSNFYTIFAQLFHDLTVFGTSPVQIMEDAEDVIRLYLPACGEYYLGCGPRLENDTLVREFTLTILQIVGMFTLDSCPRQIQKLWQDGTYDMEYVVCCMVEPNYDLTMRGKDTGKVQVVPAKWTFREVYWLKAMKTSGPLSRRGYNEKPFASFRWATVSNDAYGRSPAMDAICDTKQIQTQTFREAEFIEKGVRPPMGADVELKSEPASIMPGMTTFMNTSGGTQNKKFWPLFEVHPQWLAGITASITKVEARIDHCLYVDLFMAISRMEGVQPRNELELTKRDLERLQELGPVITLAEKEFDVIIHRCIEILRRRNLLKPLPQSLQNAPLKISYVSILRLAQRSAESVAMKDCFQTGGELSAAAKAAEVPDPLRVLNLDKAYRRYCELNNMEPDLLYTEDEVTEHDHIRAKAQSQAQQPAQAMAGVTAAKTLSETALPGGNTALGALLGGAGGGGAPQ